MFRRQLAIGLLILMITLGPILAIATDIDYQVDRSEDDVFMSEIGHMFSTTPYIILEDPGYNTLGYVLFRDIAIGRFAKINNATLSVYTTSNQSISRDSVVTIYGILSDDPILNLTTYPQTSALVNWNISEVWGDGIWHNVTVTTIVRELVNRYPWDRYKNMGFQIFSVTKNATRQFVAYDYGNPTLTARLYITYDVEPTPDEPDYPTDLNTTYGGDANSTIFYNSSYRGYDIWGVNITGLGSKDMLLSLGGAGASTYWYYRSGSGMDPVNITGNAWSVTPTSPAGIRRILRTPTALYAVVSYTPPGEAFDQVYLANSTDNGATWNRDELVSQWDGQNASNQVEGCIAQDSLGRIHVGFEAHNPTQTLAHAVRELNGSWSYVNVTALANLEDINIFIDGNDVVHFSYSAKPVPFAKKQVYYRNQTGASLGSEIRLSVDDLGNHLNSAVVAYQNGTTPVTPYVGVVWTRYDQAGDRFSFFRERDPWGNFDPAEAIGGGLLNQGIAINLMWDRDITEPDGWYRYIIAWARHDGARWRIHKGEKWVADVGVFDNSIITSDVSQSYDTPSIITSDGGDYSISFYGSADFDTYRYTVWNRNSSGTGDIIDLVNTTSNPSLALTSSGLLATLYFVVDENGTVININDPCMTMACIVSIIEPILGPMPLDPDPPGLEYPQTGFFTRFAMRRYFLMIGWGMFWGPIWLFCYRRPSGYMLGAAFIFMLIGLGLILQMPYV